MRIIDKLAYKAAEKYSETILRSKKFEPEIYEGPVDLSCLKTVSKEDILDGLKQFRKDRDSGKRFNFCGENLIEWFWHLLWADAVLKQAIKKRISEKDCKRE